MPISEQIIEIRVRYPEVDGMGYLHHSRYLQYFEMGRIELLRQAGHSYAELESRGILFVVIKAEIRYRAPAKFDDQLMLQTQLVKQTHVKLEHQYLLKRRDLVLAEGTTTIACVDPKGELQKIPDDLMVSSNPTQ